MTRNPNAQPLARLVQCVLDQGYNTPGIDPLIRAPGWYSFAEPVSGHDGGYNLTAAISPHLNRSLVAKQEEEASLEGLEESAQEAKPPSVWAALKAAFNPFACQERLSSLMVEALREQTPATFSRPTLTRPAHPFLCCCRR